MCYACIFPSVPRYPLPLFFFFFNDTATTEIYTLSLHDALPISYHVRMKCPHCRVEFHDDPRQLRSEEHTSELQSRPHLVCRLLLEKKKNRTRMGRGPEQGRQARAPAVR